MSLTPSFSLRKGALSLVLMATVAGALAQAPAEPQIQNSQLDAELFYELLVGEISAQSGDGSAAFALFLDAARKAESPRLYERAVQMALAGRSGEAALQAAQAWTRAFPGAVDANRYLVQILVGLNRMEETIAPLKKGMAAMTASDKLATVEMLPRYFARAVDRKQATTAVEQILVKEMRDAAAGPLAWSVVGQMRMQAGDINGAAAAGRRGAALNPTSAAPATLALALLQSAAQSEMEPIVTTYLAGTPAPEYRVAYLRYLVSVQRIPAAYTQALALTTHHPAFADGWLLRGSLEAQEKQADAAQASLTTYLTLRAPAQKEGESQEMDRPLVTAHVLLAQIAEQKGRYDEALTQLQSINSPPDAIRVGVREAGLLAREGKLAEALALIRALPENLPDAARAKIGAEVQLLRDNKQPEQAYALMEDAVSRYPDDVDLRYDLAMMAEKAGKLDVMEQLMRQVIAAKPDYHAAYNALGYSLADRNIRLPEARELVTKALSYAPTDPFIVDSMAWVEFRSGNVAEAERLLQGAFRERPDADIAAHLGEVLWTLGKRDEATAIWREGRRLNSESETLLETMRRLRDAP